MTHALTTFETHAQAFTTLTDGAGGRWTAPSPCEGWNASDVVAHVIDTQRDFLAGRGLDLGPAPDLADPSVAWHHHLAAVRQVLDEDELLTTTYEGWFGPTTLADTMNDFYGWDLAVHGWDLARSTGQPDLLTDDIAGQLEAIANTWGPALYGEGICKPALPVGPGAGPTERLLARLGRDARWGA